MGFKRILALALSALMLLIPVLSIAETSDFSAGDLTMTTISESYLNGYQINVSMGFDVEEGALLAQSEKAKAVAALLEKAVVDVSFYDDFGTARIRGGVTLDGVELVTGDMLIFEDGSMQLVTSLTGNMAFTLPADSMSAEGLMRLAAQKMRNEGAVDMTEETAMQRLYVASQDMASTLVNLLLGWVSGTQMKTGELYTFDYDTYIDATDTRDAVATRMIGKIEGNDLLRFLWNMASHIRDDEFAFLSALTYSITDLGVTRYDMHALADRLFPGEIDHEALMVQPSSEIADDGVPVTVEDVRYFFCKLEQNLMDAWGENTLNDLSSMIVSYDDYGLMVGFDAHLGRFSKSYPYEGDFTYSIRTDDDWQRLHTSHGELLIQNNQRVIGDLDMKLGQDVEGVKSSHFNGQMDLVDQTSGESIGFGILSALDFALTEDGAGENIEASADLLINRTGESTPVIEADFVAESQLTDLGLALSGQVNVGVIEVAKAAVKLNVTCTEYEETTFAGGQAVNLAENMTAEQIDAIKSTIKSSSTGLGLKLALKPAVAANLLKLLGE